MAARKQKVRLHFLVALTLAVMFLGVSQFLRTCRHQQDRSAVVQTERELRDLVRPEQATLQDLARTTRGSLGRDAAALLMQARHLNEQVASRPPGAGAGGTAAGLSRIRANLNRLRRGMPAVFPVGQSYLRAYYAAVDDTFQPYRICVPGSYKAEQPLPLMVTLHGREEPEPYRCLNAPRYEGALSLKPEGRGAGDYMLLGEDDVLAALRDVQQSYSVDERRVYLVGTSMGATGCWHLAVHYPHLFAGIVPVGGSPGDGAWEPRAGSDARAPHARLRAFLQASLSPASYVENLEYSHVVALHGTGGAPVPVEQTRRMASQLRGLGYGFEYLEFPRASHGRLPDWATPYAEAKVFGQPAAAVPLRFRYKTASLRHNRAWWARVDRLGDPARFARLEVDAADGVAEVKTANVNALTLLLSKAPLEVKAVRVDGREFPVRKHRRRTTFSLEKYGKQWRVPQTGGVTKRRGLSGPVSDVLRDPFVVVYGTGKTADLRAAVCRAEAERFAAQWAARYGAPPRVKADTDLTEDDVGELNLVLFGGPAVNEVTRRIAGDLPIALEGGVVRVGDQDYSGPDAGVIFCHPNPLNPERMVAVIAGTTPAALYQAWDRFGLWFRWDAYDRYKWFDYGVFDSRTAGPESFLTVGFFDNRWKLAPAGSPYGGGAAWSADPAARAELRPQGFPPYASAPEAKQDRVLLSDVRPIAIDQYRGAVGFDRSYAGRPIRLGGEAFPKGLGIRAPSALSFALGGGFRRFDATVGLTRGFDEPPPEGGGTTEEVLFEVWGDGRLLAATSAGGRPEGGPQAAVVSADVEGVAMLTLKALPEGEGPLRGSACAWGRPVVTR